MQKINNKLFFSVASESALVTPIGSTSQENHIYTSEELEMMYIMINAFKQFSTLNQFKNTITRDVTKKDDLIHYQNLLTGAKVREKRYLKRVDNLQRVFTMFHANSNVFKKGFDLFVYDKLQSQKSLLSVAQSDIRIYSDILK